MHSAVIPTGALVNGIWQDSPCIPISDSGLAYGLAIFETLRVVDGEIPLLASHLSRASKSLEAMRIPAGTIDLAMSDLAFLIESQSITDAVIRITLTAGEAERGYRLADQRQGTRIVQAFPVPEGSATSMTLGVATVRLTANQQLAGIKHSNRIEQVLARQELAESLAVDDLLLLDCDSKVIESIASNLFVVSGESLSTPLLSKCGVDGVMKTRLMEQVEANEMDISIDMLKAADELLLSNALGVKRVDVLQLEGEVVTYRPTDLGSRLLGAVPW